VVMLDLGANTECDARNLVQFAIMGAAYARIANDQPVPRVRLLNIGTEEMKGTDSLRDAAAVLKLAAADLSMRFDGFTEADKLNRGEIDVVVTDGFSGNIALKAVEGTARFVADLLRRSFASSLRSKIGFLISRPATELLKHQRDRRQKPRKRQRAGRGQCRGRDPAAAGGKPDRAYCSRPWAAGG